MVQEQKDWLSSLWVLSSFVQLKDEEQSWKGVSRRASRSCSLLTGKQHMGCLSWDVLPAHCVRGRRWAAGLRAELICILKGTDDLQFFKLPWEWSQDDRLIGQGVIWAQNRQLKVIPEWNLESTHPAPAWSLSDDLLMTYAVEFDLTLVGRSKQGGHMGRWSVSASSNSTERTIKIWSALSCFCEVM